MSIRLVNIDRNTPMLLPPDLRAWVPENHIVHFILDAVDQLPLERFRLNHRGTGSEQYPPSMMLALLIYSYATGRFSSREIEMATHCDVVVRYICGGEYHPDHDTICTFRRRNRALFEGAFVDVLIMAQQMKKLKKVGTISVDGSKFQANASKSKAVSYKRAGEQIELLQKEVEQLMCKAEEADNKPLDHGLSVPDEICRRQDRIMRLKEARELIKQRYETQGREKQAEYEQKMAEREKKKADGKAVRGRAPQTPTTEPPAQMQANFTDADSRIMKAGKGKHYEQAYNTQAAVETDSMLIVGARVSQNPNDKQELKSDLESVPEEVFKPENVLVDSGFYSEEAVKEVEREDGPTVYAAVEKHDHHVTIEDLEKKADPPKPCEEASAKEKMRHRTKTKSGKALYKLRKQTVEPVFGIIKEVMGFRRFSLRGKEKVETEWRLVCLAYNVKRLFNLMSMSGGYRRMVLVSG